MDRLGELGNAAGRDEQPFDLIVDETAQVGGSPPDDRYAGGQCLGALTIAWRRSGLPEELRDALSRRAGAGQLPAHAARRGRPALHEHGGRRGDGARARRPARPCGSTRCRRGPTGRPSRGGADARPRLLERRQGRAHPRQRRQQPRGAQRQDRQALRRLRRQRPGRSAERLRAPDHRLALEQRSAGRQGRRHHRRRAGAGHRHPQRAASGRRRRCRPTTSAATTSAPASTCGPSTSCRARASSATRRG